MKITKLKKSSFKNVKMFLGSYHMKIKKSSHKKNILGAYTISNKKSKALNCKYFLSSFLLYYVKLIKTPQFYSNIGKSAINTWFFGFGTLKLQVLIENCRGFGV
jgi:hypothetical protein